MKNAKRKKARAKPAAQTPEAPLPEAIELAKLTAILSPNAQLGEAMWKAIIKAMSYYTGALEYLDLRRSLSPQDRKTQKLRYASEPYAAGSWMAEKWLETRELEPDAPTDKAREWLKEHGVIVRKKNECAWNGKTVLREIKKRFKPEYFETLKRTDPSESLRKDLASLEGILAQKKWPVTGSAEARKELRGQIEQRAQTVRQLIEEAESKKGKSIYGIPLFVLDILANAWKAQERKRKREWAQKHPKKRSAP